MPKAKFPEYLVLDRRAARETDMNGNEHVWIPSSTEESQWMRISIRDQAEITGQNEGASSLAVRIQDYREFKRTRMQRLFRSTPDNVIDAPIGKDGAKVPLSVLGKSRKALLVWAQQNGLHLDPEAVSQLFLNTTTQQELLDAWLVETADGTSLPSLTPTQREMAELSDKIIEAVGKFGVVVGDINQIGADRVCICLKQSHGDLEAFEKYPPGEDYFKMWFVHQGNLVNLQREIAHIAGINHVRFFLEMEESTQFLHPSLEKIRLLENFYASAEHDKAIAADYFSKLVLEDFRKGNREAAVLSLSDACGMYRYVLQCLAIDWNVIQRIHGIAYPGRARPQALSAEISIGRLAKMIISAQDDFHALHQYLMQKIDIHLGYEECGILN